MTELNELVERAESLVRNAALGDGGERPRLEIEFTELDAWDADFSSFYDGSGRGEGETLADALERMLDDQAHAGDRAAASVRQSAVSALSRHLHVGSDKASAILAELEGEPTDPPLLLNPAAVQDFMRMAGLNRSTLAIKAGVGVHELAGLLDRQLAAPQHVVESLAAALSIHPATIAPTLGAFTRRST